MSSETANPQKLYILDYGAGNVRSLANSIDRLGFKYEWVKNAEDLEKADKLIFPGVGSFDQAMHRLRAIGLLAPLQAYLASGKPYFGICIGMQALFTSSEESPGVSGLGVIPFLVKRFTSSDADPKRVPHMGWNDVRFLRPSSSPVQDGISADAHYYFVHSFAAPYVPELAAWAHTTTQYGRELFVSSVRRGNILATQFHPEKSGEAGLEVLRDFLRKPVPAPQPLANLPVVDPVEIALAETDGLVKRVVACLDVRTNDAGDLVVTKGDQYDVREKADAGKGGNVRNLGKPVELSRRYFAEGADEVCFLNITSFRNSPLQDQPMLDVVRAAAETVFVPLTIGGGIKDTVDPDGTPRPALEVAGAYFRSGADKVSIGSDAVFAVEEIHAREARGEPALLGNTGIETISKAYGSQAVVVSVDPKRVYIDPSAPPPAAHAASFIRGESALAANEEEKGKAWWYQCTVAGGRETRDIDVVQLAQGVERLGAGEILLNSIDRDGSGRGFDLDLVKLVREAVRIPVVASSGAGTKEHFADVFEATGVEAALGAGAFHRRELPIESVKEGLKERGIKVRREYLKDMVSAMEHGQTI